MLTEWNGAACIVATVTIFSMIGATAVAQQPAPMSRQVINLPTRPNALCNDGSRPVFYFRPGLASDRNKWVIYLQGGVGCVSDSSCKQRAVDVPNLVSAFKMPPRMNPAGILSPQKSVNPDFAGYNHVLVHYCSSDFWAGAGDRRIGDKIWHFQGREIVDALIDQLARKPIGNAPTLATATEILVTGSSSGAMGVHNNLDRIAARLPTVKIKGLADSGWIPANLKPFGPGILDGMPSGPEALSFFNHKPDDSCVAANQANAGACMNQDFASPYVTTPMFVYADQRDPSLVSVLGIVGRPANKAEMGYMDSFARAVREGLARTPAYFAPNLTRHTVLLKPEFSTVAIGGVTFAETLRNWYFDRPGKHQIVAAPPAGQ